MAVTGLLLLGFLVSHVAGNLLLLVDEDGAAYDAYAARLRSYGPLLWVARGGLVGLFGGHILLALHLWRGNRRARGSGYAVQAPARGRSVSSATMLLTGLCILAFLLIHLWHFSFDARFVTEGAAFVKATLTSPLVIAVYGLGLVALGFHLWHALPSAVQTLGFEHPLVVWILSWGGRAVGGAILLGFWSILLF